MTTTGWIVAIAAFAVAAVVFFLLGIRYRKSVAEKEISSAEDEATRIINEAIKSSENKKREALLEAKEEILKNRSEYEKEVKERRAEQQKQERRLQQKEENLDHKTEMIEKKEEALAQKHAAMDKEQEEIKLIKRSQTEMLERISGFTAEQAKDYLIAQVESEVTHETALKIKEIEARAKDEADQRAREIVATAIQRCAADHVAEITVSVVPLPNDEMKGRIIGREGRNIRTLETLTGADLIIDDTPEAITVWLWRSSLPTAASTPPTSRRWWRRRAARWTPLSAPRASAPCWKRACAACIRSCRSCWASCTTVPATVRTCFSTPSRSAISPA